MLLVRRSALLSMLLVATITHAQQHEIYDPNIASLTVMAGDDWLSLPISTVGGKAINISFDELSHAYHRYTYKVEHCEADWSVSQELFSSDYIEGFAVDNTIDSYALSDGTYQLYTHYALSLPNADCRLTMSGNYRLTVYDDTDEGEVAVLTACFMLCDEAVGVRLGYTTNTDIDIHSQHQQLTMEVDYSGLRVAAPEQQLYIVVMQNQRRDNAVVNPRATFKTGNTLRWEHCKELIFPAGNEFHKFETLSPEHTTMGLEAVGWDKDTQQWHAYVFPDVPRRNYVYDVDADGSYLIRNSDNIDSATRCEYIMTHFTLSTPRQERGSIYLSGAWTYGQLTPQYEMQWNYESNVYEGAVLLKQGYYSYQYLVLDATGSLYTLPAEGNFFQTENTYQALVYYRGNGDRTYRLVGYTTLTTEN